MEFAEAQLKQKRSLIAPYNSKEKLVISDIKKVRRKLAHFYKKGGLDNLCILSDFDYTLTRYSLDEDKKEKLHASFDCIRNSHYAHDEYRSNNRSLYNSYYPYVKAMDIELIEKKRKMVEWWQQDLQLINSLNLYQHHFNDMVRLSNLFFRNGIDQLMRSCTIFNVPLVIVSAALTDIVHRSMDMLIEEMGCAKVDSNILHIIANNSEICPHTKKLKGFLEPLVHVSNKDEIVHQYFNSVKHSSNLLKRHNVIVMGDLIDDIKMASYLHQHENDLLTIGFFNNPQKDGQLLLEEYEKSFDIVIINDGNLHFLHYFLMRLGNFEGKCEKPLLELVQFEDLLDNDHHFHKIEELFEDISL